ncbi:MAG TPA: N-acetylmuramoyl-L-alanine amidase, partial [Puia sp.]|nr:N-acetylmuramoyl-L-alanine amidase [Puia sp.]
MKKFKMVVAMGGLFLALSAFSGKPSDSDSPNPFGPGSSSPNPRNIAGGSSPNPRNTAGGGSFDPRNHAGAHGSHPAQKGAIRTIIIDPGHGGFDTGTKGLYSKESAIALAISLKLGKAMAEEFPDIKQVFTRTTDVMPGGGSTIASGLNYRASLANKSKG